MKLHQKKEHDKTNCVCLNIKDISIEEVRQEIKKELMYLGVPLYKTGYVYLEESILTKIIKDIKLLTDVYEIVAKERSTSKENVEVAIRRVIEDCFDKMTPDIIEEVFSNTLSPSKDKATNLEFITIIEDIVKEKVSTRNIE